MLTQSKGPIRETCFDMNQEPSATPPSFTTTSLLGSTGFKLVLLITYLVVSNPDVGRRIRDFLFTSRYLALVVFLAFWALSLASFLIIAYSSSRLYRYLWGAFFAFFTLGGLAFREISGERLRIDDVLILFSEANLPLASDALGFYYFQILLCLPLVLAGFLGMTLRASKPYSESLPCRTLWKTLPIITLALTIALIRYKGGFGTRGLPIQFAAAGLAFTVLSNPGMAKIGLQGPPEPLKVRPEARKLPGHVVFVLDESVRGDFLDINRPRGCTPFLLSKEARIANFGLSSAANNCSIYTHLALRFGATVDNPAESIKASPTFWHYARAAGYKTVHLYGFRSKGHSSTYITEHEREMIDEYIAYDHLPGTEIDHAMALDLKEILKRSEPHFIYLAKRGTHTHYESAYPDTEAIFEPHMDGPSEPIGGSRERLVNSYKNAIRWSVDGFFRRLLDGPDDGLFRDSVLLYTGDHGQNLMEKGVLTHCRNQDPAPEEGVVPLFIYTEHEDLLGQFRVSSATNRDRTNHFQIFPTLLWMMGYPDTFLKSSFGPTLLEKPTMRRAFTYGDLLSRFGNDPRWHRLPDSMVSTALPDGPR